MITAAELLAASKPLRPRTPDEQKEAIKRMGLEEDQGKQCSRCFQFKAIDHFYTKGWDGETPLHNAWCKECCRARSRERSALSSKQAVLRTEGNT